MIGRRVAHYEIVAVLGRGGMGEVYRAHDPRTGRDVAIKSLPSQLASDPERLARFRQEARTLASLNHRNIAGLYGVEEQDGHSYLVMELAEGEDLARRIAQGPVPLDDALDIALQIAEGLEEAHEKGVIHRDLKPANLRVDPNGTVKILDFGLARAVEGASVAGEGDPMLSPTITAAMTQAGTVLGTAGYMSPEQARGRGIDRRSDLWSFGVILWEMLTGRRLFEGDTISDTIASVLKTEPDWNALPPDTPTGVRRLIERCLERDVRYRLRDVGEARIRLERWKADPSTMDESFGTMSTPIAVVGRRTHWLPWTVAGLAVIAAAFFALRPRAEAPAAPSLVTEVVLEGADAMNLEGYAALQLSPDGRYLVWSTEQGIRLRRRDDLRTQFVPTSVASSGVTFSPDSRWILYDDGAILYRRSVEGGASIEVFRVENCRGLTWIDDRRIVVAPTFVGGLLLVDISNGSSRALTELGPNERSHRWPSAVPGHDEVLFMTQMIGAEYEEASIEAVSLSDGRRRVLHQGGAFPRYAPTGHLLFARGETLLAVPYRPGSERPTGLVVPVIENLFTRVGDQEVDDGSAQYGFDAYGTLLYRTASRGDGQRSRLAWLDLETGITSPFGQVDEYELIGVSSDGTHLAVRRGSGRDNQIVVIQLENGSETTLSRGRSSRFVGTWSGDGQEVFWTEPDSMGSAFELLRAPRDGSRPPRAVGSWPQTVFIDDVSRDGRWLTVSGFSPGTAYDLHRLDLRSESATLVPLLVEPLDQGYSAISPDGRLLLYGSGSNATEEYFVRFFDGGGARWRVGAVGSPTLDRREMHWGANSDRIYEFAPEGIRVHPVRTTDSGLVIGRAEDLFRVDMLYRPNSIDVAPHPDGKRMIVLVPASVETEVELPRIVLASDWFERLRALTDPNL